MLVEIEYNISGTCMFTTRHVWVPRASVITHCETCFGTTSICCHAPRDMFGYHEPLLSRTARHVWVPQASVVTHHETCLGTTSLCCHAPRDMFEYHEPLFSHTFSWEWRWEHQSQCQLAMTSIYISRHPCVTTTSIYTLVNVEDTNNAQQSPR